MTFYEIVKDEIKQIEEDAGIVDLAFKRFHEMQIEQEMDAQDFKGAKENLREKLKELSGKLDQYLAKEYGIDLKKKKAFDDWRSSHQPFHWFVEFYGIMSRGGFDVTIGNPPYIDYNKVKTRYLIKDYFTEPSRNLYAFTLERSLQLISKNSAFGVIVPIAFVSIGANGGLRHLLLNYFSSSYCANFAIRPAKLFHGVEQRLTIFIGDLTGKKQKRICSTKYNQWFAAERPLLLDKIEYSQIKVEPYSSIIVKPCRQIGMTIIKKIQKNSTKIVGDFLTIHSPYKLVFHRTPGYWIRFMDFLPYFNSPQGDRSKFHIRELFAAKPEYMGYIGSIMSSTLFFYWFFASGNCRNLTLDDVTKFPIGNPNIKLLMATKSLFKKLMENYKFNSETKNRGESEFQEFNWIKSKPIVDQIDEVISGHFGLSIEETDFIINYDIKYRMGQ